MTTTWRAALYGPVNITPYDPIWLGVRVHSNNTGEVSAIGEACRYLLRIHQQLPQDHPRRATICYDSTYAYGVVTRLTKGRENTELIDTVASLLEATRRIFQVDFKHIRAHTDIYGNEAADRLAGRGAAGRISPHAIAWTENFAGPMGTPPPPPAPRKPLDKVCDALRLLRVFGKAVGRFWNVTLAENLSDHAICHNINLIVAVQIPQTGHVNTVITHLLFLSKVGRITKDIPIRPKLSETVSLLKCLNDVREDRPWISHIHARTPPHPYLLPPHPPNKKKR